MSDARKGAARGGRPRLGSDLRERVTITADLEVRTALDGYACRYRVSRSQAVDVLLRGALGLDVGLALNADPPSTLGGVELRPTVAMVKGQAFVAGCRQCGALVAVPSTLEGTPRAMLEELGSCPACGRDGQWYRVSVPSGPFHVAGGSTVAEASSRSEGRPEASLQNL